MPDARMWKTQVMLGPAEWREVMDRDDRAATTQRGQTELRRVIDGRPSDSELGRKQDRIEREHRELGTAKTERVEITMPGDR